MKKLFFTLFSLAVIGIACLSCKIGLGEAVDTQPPEVTIESPEVGAIIRDKFFIAGTWTDDGTIKGEGGLTVNLERTDDSIEPITLTSGTVDKDKGTWNCLIDPADATTPLIDGEYQATITMTDTYEHKTVKTITFTIDNTAPIIVLQRPSAKKGDSKPDSYGQSFTLEGQAADDNNIDSIDVSLYAEEECTTLLHTVHLTNVPPTIELDVAKFAEGVENDYSKIYGSSSLDGGTKQFYCKIIAYDGAQRYPVDGSERTDADKRGNSTDHYYLYEEISGSVLNKYKITEVYHMHNGTYTGEAESRSAVIASVKETLQSNEVRIGSFTLNPANNPTYTVSGRNPLTRDGHDFDTGRVEEVEISNGSKVQVEVSTGLDGIALRGDTLGVYVIECDANGTAVAGANKITIIPAKEAKDGTQLLTDEAAINARSALIGKSGTSYKLTVTLDAATVPGLSVGKKYIFGVDGYDQNNTEVADFGNVYGFYFVSSGSAPKVEVTAPANGITYLSKGSELQVKGYAQADLTYPALTIKVIDSAGIAVHTKEYNTADIAAGVYPETEIACTSPNNKQRIDFNYTIPKDAFSQTECAQYTLSVIAVNGEKDTTIDRTIIYDVNGPNITIESVEPEADYYEIIDGLLPSGTYDRTKEDGSKKSGKYLNGQVTIKLSIADEYDAVNVTAPEQGQPDHRPYFEVLKGGVAQAVKVDGNAAAEKIFITTPAKQIFTLDTTTFTDNDSITIKVHAWDRAGNQGVDKEANPVTIDAIKTYTVHSNTDYPVILPQNSKTMTLAFETSTDLGDTGATGKNKDKLNFLPASSSLALKLVDDDGIKNYKFEMGEANSDNTDKFKVPLECDTLEGGSASGKGIFPSGEPKEISFTYTLPPTGGDYMCRMTLTDKNDKQVQKLFWITVTGAAPTVTVDMEPTDKRITRNTTAITTDAKTKFTSTIHISSEYPPFTIVRKEPKNLSPLDYQETVLCGESNKWQTTADYIDGPFTPLTTAASNYILYEVTDNNNHTGTFTVYYNVDNKKPTIKADTFAVPDTDQTEGNSFRFVVDAEDVKANEKEVASGVSKIQYVFNSTTDTSKYTEVTAQSLNQVVAFESDDSFDSTTRGKKTIYVRAIDAVGNIGDWAEKDFYYDTAAPSATVTQYGDDTAGYKDVEGDIQTYKLFKLKGVASDDWGVKKITITESKDGGAATDVGTVTGTTNWTSPELPLAANRENGKPKTGSYIYTITVTDKTADVPGIAESKIKKTTTTVTVKIDTEAPTITIGSPEADSYLAGVSTVISGTVQDGTNIANQGLKNIYWAITDSATVPTAAVTDASVWTKLEKTTVGTGSANWELPRSIGTGRTGSDSGTIYEGEWYLHVKAEDKAGNLSGAVSRHFYVDQGAPKISDVKKDTQSGEDLVAKAINGTYYYTGSETNFELSGKVLESNGLAEFTAKVDSGTPANITKPTANAEAQEWTYTVSNVTADTLKKVVISAKDVVNRETSETYNIYRDTQPPKITFTNPDTDVSGEDALTGSSYTFRANIVDEGSGVKDNKYKYMFSKTNLDTDAKIISSAEAGTGWTEYTDGQAFNKQMSIISGTTGSDATKLCEGHWYLYFYAIDSVGIKSVKKLSFWVDLAKPEVTTKIDTETDVVKSTDYTETTTNIKTKKDFIVKYKAEDTHGLDTNYGTNGIKVVVKKNGTALTTTTSTTNVYYSIGTVSNDMYPISLKVPTNVVGDDEYTFEISAKDLAGKVTTVIRNVRLDTKGPELSITTPELDENDTSVFKDWQTSKNIKIVGTASDATGVSAVYYWLNAATAPTPPTSGTSALTESTWTGTQTSPKWTKASGSGNWTIDLSNVPDSATNTLYIAAVDTNGNVCVRQDKTLKVDKVGPVLDETAIGLVGTSVLYGETFVTLSGTISDSTSGVKGITISDNKNEASSWDATITDSDWTATINIGNENNKLKDAVHTLTIEAEDNAGNTSKQDRSVHVDTKAPTTGAFTIETAKANTIGSNDWYNESAINIKIVSVTDPVQDGYASGITAVEYTTDNKDDSTATWISMTQNTATPTTWTGKVNCNLQGANTISVRVKDAAGNVLNTNLSKTVYIDTVAPETPTSWWVNNTEKFDSQMLSNKRAGVDVYIVAKDANASGTNTPSGIASVSYGNSTVTSTSKYTPAGGTELDVYKLSIAATDIANGACTIKIKDKVGKETEWSPFSFSVDTEAPKIAINTINDADKDTAGIQVNKKFNLKGTASDNRQVKQLDVCYYYDNKWTNIYSTTDADSIFNWTKEIDTVKSATCTFGNTTDMDGKEVTFCVIITDEAGNRNLDTGTTTITDNTSVVSGTTKRIPTVAPENIADGNKAKVKIDQDSDRPIVKINNFSLSGMTSSNSVYLTGQPTIWGMVSDDDGLDTVEYRTRPVTTPAASWGAWTTLTVSDGQFSIPDLPNGNQEFQFQVKDSAGNTFETGASTSLTKIKLQDKDGTKFGTSSATDASLYVRVDTENPTFGEISLNSYTGTSATTATSTGDSLGASTVVGGVSKKAVEIVTNAQDTNGIKGITIEFVDSAATPKKVYYRSNSNVSVSGVSTYAATGSVTKTTDSTVYTYTTPKIDLSTFAEGLVKVTITAWDNAGQSTPNQTAITIDNTAPTFEITTPAADIEDDEHAVFGIQSNTVGGNTGSALDVETISYKITTSATTPTDGWNVISGAFTTASLVFDGAAGHLPNLHDQIATVVSQAAADADDNVTLYVHFKATDNCGNSGYAKRKLIVIPNGDKPSVKFTYPETNGKALAGTIRIYGTVEQPIGLTDKVFVQIDPNYNGTTFNASGWKDAFDTCCSGKNTEYKFEDFGPTGARQTGIVANGTQNWNLVLNANKELNATSGSRSVALRVYAISSGGKLSEPFVRTFTVDPNAPHIGGDGTGEIPLEVVQFESGKVGDFTKITARQSYSNEMWLKGDWYLIASVTDNSGIKELTLDEGISAGTKSLIKNCDVNSSDLTLANGTAGGDKACKITQNTNVSSDTAGKNWNMCIPLCTGTGSGTLKYTFTATENTDNNNICTETITIYYDNKAPQIGTKDHTKYNMNPDIKQSDGFYTLSGYATDADTTAGAKVSGMQGIAFYFMRRGTVGTTPTTRVYDPMWENKSVTVRTGAPTDASGTNATDIVYNNGLYWKKKTVTRNANNLPVLTLSATDDNIYAGGYAQLAGSIYRIKSVSGTTVTLDGKPPVQSTNETAYFALALVVDNFDKAETATGRTKITSGYGKGYYSASSTADDGDLMQESWDGDSNEGKWTAMINSANIPDGPIELHYVVFDQAWNYSVGIVGNVNETTYATYKTLDVTENENTTNGLKKLNTDDSTNKLASRYHYAFTDAAYVSNNAPRIVGVTVGCDYDDDGTISDSEKTEKFVTSASRLFSDVSKFMPVGATKSFIASSDGTKNGNALKTIKGDSAIEIEIVGGNGNLYMQYHYDGSYKDHDEITDFAYENSGNALSVTRNTKEGWAEDDDNGLGYYEYTTLPAIEFTEEVIATTVATDTAVTSPSWFTFEVWDATEETTKFVDSQYSELKLPLSIQVHDTTKPNVVFNDLYWKSSTNNSVYMNPTTEALEGHIELKDFLGSGFTNANYGIDDDKVSGKVTFSGYAYDNKRLSALRFGISSAKGNTTTNQAWPQSYVDDVPYASGTWTAKGDENIGIPYYYFKVYDDAEHGAYMNEDGHKVYWELTVDTSYVQQPGREETSNRWALGKDLYVWVQATDAKSNKTVMNGTDKTNGDDTTNIRPNYKVDVVPYITGIKSRLGSKADETRSSSGRYQIASDETGIQLTGYNLVEGSAPYTITTPTNTGNYTCTITRGTGGSAVNFVAVNNINDNSAVGSTPAADQGKVKNKYNMQPSTNNQTLTDDVAFDIWQFNSKAVITNTNHSMISQPVMKYNHATGNLGFAFSDGANFFSMPNGTDSSYTVWEKNYAKYVQSNFVFDKAGRAHAISVGIDTYPEQGSYKSGRMNLFDSKWGQSGMGVDGNFSGTHSIHLDAIGEGDVDIREDRFSSIAMALAEHDDHTLYIAYYDQKHGRIVFRWGNIGDSKGATNKTDNGNQLYHNGDGEPGFVVDASLYSIIANGTGTGKTGYNAGEYVDLAVIPGASKAADTVCVVWFTGSSLMYSYKTNPCNDNDLSTTTTNGHWSTPETLLENGGKFCKIRADANGGLHIAAFDGSCNGVTYLYKPSYSGTTTKVIVDAANGPYDEVFLDVALNSSSKAVPTISYYANGKVKMAIYEKGITKTTGVPEQSWGDNGFTGIWDVGFVPTSASFSKADHINVALPKNANGTLENVSVAATKAFTEAGARGSGTVGGNGTLNPILGYAIYNYSETQGYMEIAQRKN